MAGAVVQGAGAHGFASSLDGIFGTAVTTGNMLVAGCFTRAAFSTIVDTGGRTWTQITLVNPGSGELSAYWAPVGTGGDTPTVTFTATGGDFINLCVGELSGLAVVSPIDSFVSAVNSMSGFPFIASTGTTATATADGYGVSFISSNGGNPPSTHAGFTEIYNTDDTNFSLHANASAKAVANAATFEGLADFVSSDGCVGIGIIFKLATGGGATAADTATGSATATATVIKLGTIASTGAGTATATAITMLLATIANSATGSASATAITVKLATIAGTGAGTATASATALLVASASSTGLGTSTAIATSGDGATASNTATGTATASATTIKLATIANTATSSQSAIASIIIVVIGLNYIADALYVGNVPATRAYLGSILIFP